MKDEKDLKTKVNKVNKEMQKIAKEEAEKLFELLGSKASVEVSLDEENQAVSVNVMTEEEAGLLIGRHGDTLNSIQSVLGMIVSRKAGEWVRVIVNIGDWRQKQESHLVELANTSAQRAKQTGEDQPLYNLTAAERRIVHMTLSSDKEVETESLGEGDERYLVVRAKNKKS